MLLYDFFSTSGLSASLGLLTDFSLDYGSLFPAACMSGNVYYILDIVDNVTRSLGVFIAYWMLWRTC